MFIDQPQDYYSVRMTLASSFLAHGAVSSPTAALEMADALLEESMQRPPSPLYFTPKEEAPETEGPECSGCEEGCATCPESPEGPEGT